MIDQYAFLTLALAHEEPSDYQFQRLEAFSWQKFSSQSYRWFLSLAVSLAILTASHAAQALVRQGDSNSQVTQVQQRLQQLGYFNANVTGYFGAITRDAVIRFQRDSGLVADGVVGPVTLTTLGLASQPYNPVLPNRQLIGLGLGDQGPGVEDLQSRLQALGYFNANRTRYFGPVTQNAVLQLQRDNGLNPTGVVSEETLAILNSPYVTLPQTLPNSTSLAFGDYGPDVTALQQRLRALGYYNGEPTGYFDADTEAAVQQFQRVQGIPSTGVVGATTLAALNIPPSTVPAAPPFPPVLRLGDQGNAVTVLQTRLNRLGYYTGPINGFFDLPTQQAVITFQRANRLTPTGEVGPTTAPYLGVNFATVQNSTYAVPQRPAVPFQAANSLSSLSLGDTGVEVRKLQRRLRELKYYSGSINGFFDQATETALILFQRANNITETGVAGPTTQAYLFNLRPVSASSTQSYNLNTVQVLSAASGSNRVQKLQERLRIQGLYNGPMNGVYDTQTQQAVAQARTLYGVNADLVLFGGL